MYVTLIFPHFITLLSLLLYFLPYDMKVLSRYFSEHNNLFLVFFFFIFDPGP